MQRLMSSEVTSMKGNNLWPARGFVLDKIDQRLMKILDLEDGSIHQRHYDSRHLQFCVSPEDVVPGEEVRNSPQTTEDIEKPVDFLPRSNIPHHF